MMYRIIWLAILFFLFSDTVYAARYIEPPDGYSTNSNFLADLINISPILIGGIILLFTARLKNTLRFFALWLGVAFLAKAMGFALVGQIWGGVGWLVLFFLNEHWVDRSDHNEEDKK